MSVCPLEKVCLLSQLAAASARIATDLASQHNAASASPADPIFFFAILPSAKPASLQVNQFISHLSYKNYILNLRYEIRLRRKFRFRG